MVHIHRAAGSDAWGHSPWSVSRRRYSSRTSTPTATRRVGNALLLVPQLATLELAYRARGYTRHQGCTRYALGTSRRVAQGSMGGCCADLGPAGRFQRRGIPRTGDGLLSRDEFVALLGLVAAKAGHTYTHEHLSAMFTEADLDCNDAIDLNELLLLLRGDVARVIPRGVLKSSAAACARCTPSQTCPICSSPSPHVGTTYDV